MKTPAEVRTTAARRFRASCRRWLAGHLGLPDDSAWPFAVPLGVPSEREVLADPQKTLDWRDAWSAEAESGRLKVAFAVRDWTACGRQTVPNVRCSSRPKPLRVQRASFTHGDVRSSVPPASSTAKTA